MEEEVGNFVLLSCVVADSGVDWPAVVNLSLVVGNEVVVPPKVDRISVVVSSVVGKSVLVADGVDILVVVLASAVERGPLVDDTTVVAASLVVC